MIQQKKALRSTGVWSLADQGIVSCGNFLSSLLLGRYLTGAEYGIYALLLGLVLLLNNVHGALVTYPISVLGADRPRDEFSKITGNALVVTGLLLIPSACVTGIITLTLGRGDLLPWVLTALVMWQLQETLRRSLMARLQHRATVVGDAISFLGQAIILWILAAKFGRFSLWTTFAVLALTSALAAALQLFQVRPSFHGVNHVSATVSTFWRVGRWNLMTTLLGVLTNQAFPWVLVSTHGPVAVGAMQAVGNLVGAINPIMFGVGNLIVPAAARVKSEFGVERAKRVSLRFAAQGSLFVIPYLAVLIVWPRNAIRFAYGNGSPYLEHVSILRLWAVIFALAYAAQVLAATLNGLGRSQHAFKAQLISAATAVVGLPLTAVSGLQGASIGVGIAVVARLATSVRMVWGKRNG